MPIAPPQELRMSASATWPSSSIFSATRNSFRNESLRRPSEGACVRRERADRAVRKLEPPKAVSRPPDREHDMWRHAELALDAEKRGAMLVEQLAALRREACEHRLAQVIRRRLHKLGLTTRRRFRPAGNDEVGQRQVGLQPAGRGIEGRTRDA